MTDAQKIEKLVKLAQNDDASPDDMRKAAEALDATQQADLAAALKRADEAFGADGGSGEGRLAYSEPSGLLG